MNRRCTLPAQVVMDYCMSCHVMSCRAVWPLRVIGRQRSSCPSPPCSAVWLPNHRQQGMLAEHQSSNRKRFSTALVHATRTVPCCQAPCRHTQPHSSAMCNAASWFAVDTLLLCWSAEESGDTALQGALHSMKCAHPMGLEEEEGGPGRAAPLTEAPCCVSASGPQLHGGWHLSREFNGLTQQAHRPS